MTMRDKSHLNNLLISLSQQWKNIDNLDLYIKF